MSQVVQLIRQVVRELAGYMDQLVPQVRIHKLHVLRSFIFSRGVPKKTLHKNSFTEEGHVPSNPTISAKNLDSQND